MNFHLCKKEKFSLQIFFIFARIMKAKEQFYNRKKGKYILFLGIAEVKV